MHRLDLDVAHPRERVGDPLLYRGAHLREHAPVDDGLSPVRGRRAGRLVALVAAAERARLDVEAVARMIVASEGLEEGAGERIAKMLSAAGFGQGGQYVAVKKHAKDVGTHP